MVTDHVNDLRARVRAVPSGAPPAPWVRVPPVAVGGLTEIGVGEAGGEELILTVSSSGRAVFDLRGQRLARDRAEPDDDWHDPFGLEALGIGPLAGQRVRIAGLAGGGLPTGTRDGWGLVRFGVDWPADTVVLEPPGCGVLWPGHEAGCLAVFTDDASELRACGFTPSGRAIVLATGSDLHLFVRPDAYRV